MRKTLFALTTAALLLACQKENDETTDCWPEAEGDVTVALNNCLESDGAGKSSGVCFEQLVEDSRCPSYAVCVWPGVAVAKFSVNLNSTQYRFSLSTLKSPSFPPTDMLIAGYRIKLVDVLPYPGSGAPGPVRALLRISR